MRRAILLAVLSSWTGLASAATVIGSTDTVIEAVPEHLSFLENPQFSVMVVSVLEATIEHGTNGAPPEGVLAVREVLRGKYVMPGEHPYRILAPRYPESFDENNELSEEWYGKQLDGPAAGDELIVIAYVWKFTLERDPTIHLQGPLIRYTPENRAAVESRLVHDSPLQPVLFLAILTLSAGAWLALVLGRRMDRAAGAPRWLAAVPIALPPGALALYTVYESTIGSHYDIRVDLLLLWPALAAGVVVWFVGLARWRHRGRRPVGPGARALPGH